jgi:MFS family permease
MAIDRWAVLRIRDFRLLLLTRAASFMALQTQAVIVGWQIYQLKPDPLLLGLVGLAEAIPAISCSFVSGHMVDNYRPALIFRMSISVMFLNACLLWLAITPVFPLDTHGRIAVLFLCVFISGAARSFTSPAVFSLVPQVVTRARIAEAAAWNSSTFQIATIIGPAVGGLVFGAYGAIWAFAIPAVFQLVALVGSFSLSRETGALRNTAAREPFSKSIRTGLAFAFGNKILLSAMTLDMFSVLFGGAVAVLPIYADKVLHVGSMGLGFLRAAPAVGSVIIGFSIAMRPMKVISGLRLLWVVAGFGLTTLLFAVSTNFYLALLFLALSGAFDGVSMVTRQTILQMLTPDHMRGRVSSVSSVFITSSNEIGAFESGIAARLMGLVPSVIFGGAMTLVIVAATALLSPELRRTRIAREQQDDGSIKKQ